jgi:hypothetical protein
MKIQHSNISKKRLILTSAGVSIVLLATFAYYVFGLKGHIFGWSPYTVNSVKSIDYDKPSPDQTNTGNDIKQQSVKNNQTKSGVSGSDQPPAPTPQGNGKSIVETTISSANQTDSYLQFRTLISTLDSTGTCSLVLTNQTNQSLHYTAGVQPLSNTSTCKGFDIPLSALSSGIWKATVTYENPTLTGTATKSITIR